MEKVEFVPYEPGLVVKPNALDANAGSYGFPDHCLELGPFVIGGSPRISEHLGGIETVL